MIYVFLFSEFFKIGLFSFGGGYATIPFLYHISAIHHWYSLKELTQMIAIAAVTPGPVGINVATYAGFKTAGILGAATATLSEILPSFILVILLAKLLKMYSENFYVKSLLSTLKPITCALLVAVSFGLIQAEVNNIKSVILLIGLIIVSWKTKKSPIFYMLIAGMVGILTNILNL